MQTPARISFGDVAIPGAIAEHFRWKDRNDNFHDVTNMETRHLFYTLRMIWNHRMPAEARFQQFKRYSFGNFYSPQYMLSAVYHIGRELANRDNLTERQEKELAFMAGYFSTKLSSL